MIPAIIDVEASGFGPGSYPIEIGIALPNGATHCFLIKPLPEWTHWDQEQVSIHQIQHSILTTHGKPAEEVAVAINDLLRGQMVYSERWGMVTTWISQLYYAARVPQMFMLESLRSLIHENIIDSWENQHQTTVDSMELTRHRASSDALVVQKTFVRAHAHIQANTDQL